MLELDDIQAFLIAPPRHPFGHYFFLTFDKADDGRAWLARGAEQVARAKAVLAAYADGVVPRSGFYVVLTHNGLRALGLGDDSLATFPEEFRLGMPARAEILGDTGPNSPEQWDGGLASDRLHAAI